MKTVGDGNHTVLLRRGRKEDVLFCDHSARRAMQRAFALQDLHLSPPFREDVDGFDFVVDATHYYGAAL